MIHLNEGQQQLAESFVHNKTALVTGAAGTTVAVTPPERIAGALNGDWLLTNGVGVLSWAEIIQVIGAIWVLCLIVDRAIVGIRLLKSSIKGAK